MWLGQGSAGGSMVLENEQLNYTQQWAAPRSVTAHDLICTTCWTQAQDTTQMHLLQILAENVCFAVEH